MSDQLKYYYSVVERVEKIQNPYTKESVYKHLFLQGVFRAWDSNCKEFFFDSIEKDLTLSGV